MRKGYRPDDWIGRNFGYVTVLSRSADRKGMWFFLCRCTKCGKEWEVSRANLPNTSQCRECSYYSLRGQDLSGKTFGHIQVLSRLPTEVSPSGYTYRKYLCRCLKCGKEWGVLAGSLTSGRSTQCVKCSRKKGWETSHPLYVTWTGINTRCYNTHTDAYAYYGGRGVKNFWSSDPAGFISYIEEHLGAKLKGHTLDRIDPDGDYCPGNLRWADKRTQAINRRRGKNNKSGVTGVYQTKEGRWAAHISASVNGWQYLGAFNTKEEATTARKMAEAEHYCATMPGRIVECI